MKYGGWGRRSRSPFPQPRAAINPIKFSAAEYFLGAVETSETWDRDRRPPRSYPAFYREIIGTVLNRPSLSTEYKRGRMKLQVSRRRFNIVGGGLNTRGLTRRDKPRPSREKSGSRQWGEGEGFKKWALRKWIYRDRKAMDVASVGRFSNNFCRDFVFLQRRTFHITRFPRRWRVFLFFFFFYETPRDLWFYCSRREGRSRF